MKTLELVVDLKDLNLSEEDKKQNPIQVSTQIIKNIVLSVAQVDKGLSEEDRRIYYKLCDVFDKAIETNSGTVNIDDSYAEFIKKTFAKARLVPNELLRKVEDLVSNIK